jgi:hypothetical protein
MRASSLAQAELRLLRPAEPSAFTSTELDDLPEPARRHLTQAITPGTPLATSARLRMRGQIKIGRWLPFRARQVLDPHHSCSTNPFHFVRSAANQYNEVAPRSTRIPRPIGPGRTSCGPSPRSSASFLPFPCRSC